MIQIAETLSLFFLAFFGSWQGVHAENSACKDENCGFALDIEGDASSNAIELLQLGSVKKHHSEGMEMELGSVLDQHSKSVASFMATRHQFVKEPTQITMQEMENVSTQGMVQGHFATPWLGENMSMWVFPGYEDYFVSTAFIRGNLWDSDKISYLCSRWMPNVSGNFVDVGANIGAYTVSMASCLGNKGKVLSVEGTPSIARHLMASVAANKLENVALYNYAVGSWKDGDEVQMQDDSRNKGHSSVGEIGSSTVFEKGVSEAVPLTTLDAMLSTNPNFSNVLAMKMDIEGFEGRALAGARELFWKFPPCYLQIEFNADWLAAAGTPLEDVLRRLAVWGYDLNVTAEMAAHGPTCKRDERNRCIRDYFLAQKNIEKCKERVQKGPVLG